jgi:phospholipase/lecithinase/hemolysin
MQAQRFPSRIVFLLFVLITITAPANAGDYAAIIVYRDSFSDNGNLFTDLGIPQPPYWNGRYSNGPVAVEHLSSCLGVQLIDEAWGGATTGIGDVVDNGTTTTLGYDNLPGMTTSFNGTISSFPPGLVSTSLVIVWGGINDFSTNGLTTLTADHAVSDILALVKALQANGAKQILVPGIPDLGLAPLYLAEGKGGYANYISDYFNQKLRMSLPSGVLYFDTATLYRNMTKNPSLYGLTNVTQPCYTSQGSLCGQPYQYLYWDLLHPTTHIHQILAREFSLTTVGLGVCPLK